MPVNTQLQTHAAIPSTSQTPRGIGFSLRGVHKGFDGREVLKGLNLTVLPGEAVAVVGKSGCGKSTLLRLIAGIDKPDSGEIGLFGTAGGVRVMFQDARLLPWKTVRDNVAIGLPAGEKRRADAALAKVGLLERAADWPAVLSGGQKQRVALARALVSSPGLLLLDEPLGALDALTRYEMRALIGEIRAEQGFSMLLVTHDVEEAAILADRAICLAEGAVALDCRIETEHPGSRTIEEIARAERTILNAVVGTTFTTEPYDDKHL